MMPAVFETETKTRPEAFDTVTRKNGSRDKFQDRDQVSGLHRWRIPLEHRDTFQICLGAITRNGTCLHCSWTSLQHLSNFFPSLLKLYVTSLHSNGLAILLNIRKLASLMDWIIT